MGRLRGGPVGGRRGRPAAVRGPEAVRPVAVHDRPTTSADEILERSHRLAVSEERWADAAETAFWFAFLLLNANETARGGAWLARSRTIAAEHDVPASVAALPDAAEARGLVMAGRTDEGLALGLACARTGTLEGNPNLEVLGRLGVGWALLRQGRREEALAGYDEVMLTVSRRTSCTRPSPASPTAP